MVALYSSKRAVMFNLTFQKKPNLWYVDLYRYETNVTYLEQYLSWREDTKRRYFCG